MRVLPVMWHLLPVVPAALGQWWLFGAACVLVALAWIKTKKLQLMISEIEASPASPARERELESLRKTLQMWRSLTFHA
jgi:hypothetical protein